MDYKIIDNAEQIRETFLENFVLSWEEFQVKQRAWIDEMAKKNHPVNLEWYKESFLWDKMNPDFPTVSMKDALNFLEKRDGTVLFMSEKGEGNYYYDKILGGVIAEANAQSLAEKIKQEWFDSYRLAAQDMYNPDTILPDDLYVFDYSMKWCVVFTHETTDWESGIDNPMKAAESRLCIICNV